MIRILVVDDQALVRESLSHLFARQPDMQVTSQCSGAEEALQELKRKQVDVMVATGRLGTQFIAAVRAQGGAEAIVIITDSVEAETSLAALHSGARAILSRHVSSETLTKAVRVVASGGVWVNQNTVDLLVAAVGTGATAEGALSEREQAILEGLSEGQTNRRIAEGLGMSEGAVKAALHRLYRKTQTVKRAQLVRRLLEGALGVKR